MRKPFSIKAGFTIVELLVVVALIGILSAVSVPAYFNHILRARQSVGQQNLFDIKTGQEKYFSLFDTYANPGVLSSADTFASYVNFDTADTTRYLYTITGNANTFKASLKADLNNDGTRTDCWSISSTTSTPQQDTTTGTCSSDGEGFSFSILADII